MEDYIHADTNPRNGALGAKFTSFIFAIYRQVDADPKTTAMEMRLVYVISQLLNRETRVCFPLQSTLAKRLRVTDRTVRQCIAGLVDRGHLVVRHRGRDSSAIYELILQDRNAASGLDLGRPEDTIRSWDDNASDDRKSDVARPETSGRKTGSTLPTEPTSVTNLNNQERGAPSAPRRSLSGDEVDSSRRRPKTPPPDAVNIKILQDAKELAAWPPSDAKEEFQKFRDHHLGKGTLSSDWEATWRTWARRGAAYDKKQLQQPVKIIDQEGRNAAPKNQAHPTRRRSNTERLMRGA